MVHWCPMLPFTEHPPDGVIVNDIQSHSVQVSWEAVEDAEMYGVTFAQTMGDSQLGLCSESHMISVDTSSLRIVVGQTANDMLRAHTTYFITVVARSDVWGSSGESEPITITTHQTSEGLSTFHPQYGPLPLHLSLGATVSPSNVRARVVSSTAISVQWNGLISCIEANGLIVKYRVEYRAESGGMVQTIEQNGEWNVIGAEISLTELTPFTNYSIQVAAVNEQGDVGLYSDPLNRQTQEDSESVFKLFTIDFCHLSLQFLVQWSSYHFPLSLKYGLFGVHQKYLMESSQTTKCSTAQQTLHNRLLEPVLV